MNQRAIIYVLLAIIGIPVMIQIGAWSATDPLYAGASAVVLLVVLVVVQLGNRVWLLIPFFAGFTGALNILPGGFAPRDLAVGLVVVVMLPLWVVRRFPLRFTMGGIEVSILILLVFVGQAYVRNPVGLSIFGTGSIGGRPYFEIAVSVVSFLLISILVVDLRSIKTMVLATFAGQFISALITAVLSVIPGVAPYAARFYSSGAKDISGQSRLMAGPYYEGTGRLTFLAGFAPPIMNLTLAFKNPLQFANPQNFKYLLLAIFSAVCVLMSGFRSRVALVGFQVIVAAFLHRKPMQIVFMLMVASPLLALLLALQGSVLQLPLSAQRALSFLPADWDQTAVKEAQESTDWRFEMWEAALTSDRYIRNKWVGDGFGFTAREMAYQEDLMVKGLIVADQQEYFLMTGNFHSGPIETIKRIGYLGLFALLVIMGLFVKKAFDLVSRTRGTPYSPYAIFIALPLVVHPLMFIFVFGEFKGTLSVLLAGGAGIRILGNSFAAWLRQRSSVEGVEQTEAGDGRASRIGPVGAPV